MGRMPENLRGIFLLTLYCETVAATDRQNDHNDRRSDGLTLVATKRFYERQHNAIGRICYRPSVCLSVCMSITRVDQSKWLKLRLCNFVAPSL